MRYYQYANTTPRRRIDYDELMNKPMSGLSEFVMSALGGAFFGLLIGIGLFL